MKLLKSVIVSAKGYITEESLKKYFQDPTSQGGEIQSLSPCHDGFFEVKFKNEKGEFKKGLKL